MPGDGSRCRGRVCAGRHHRCGRREAADAGYVVRQTKAVALDTFQGGGVVGEGRSARTPTRAKVFGGCSWGLVLAPLVPVGLILACVAFLVFSSFGLPLEWEIPEGYQGWAALTVGDPACPPRQRRGLTIVVTVDQFGRACTSDPPLARFRHTSYYYVAADGRRTRLPAYDSTYPGVQASHGGLYGSSSRPFEIEFVYIGTWAAADRSNFSTSLP